MKRIAAESDGMKDIPDRILVNDKKIDVNDYINICWDNSNFEILNFKNILKGL